MRASEPDQDLHTGTDNERSGHDDSDFSPFPGRGQTSLLFPFSFFARSWFQFLPCETFQPVCSISRFLFFFLFLPLEALPEVADRLLRLLIRSQIAQIKEQFEPEKQQREGADSRRGRCAPRETTLGMGGGRTIFKCRFFERLGEVGGHGEWSTFDVSTREHQQPFEEKEITAKLKWKRRKRMAGGGTTDVDFSQGCSYQGFGRSEGGGKVKKRGHAQSRGSKPLAIDVDSDSSSDCACSCALLSAGMNKRLANKLGHLKKRCDLRYLVYEMELPLLWCIYSYVRLNPAIQRTSFPACLPWRRGQDGNQGQENG
jgi:hypothetical protein